MLNVDSASRTTLIAHIYDLESKLAAYAGLDADRVPHMCHVLKLTGKEGKLLSCLLDGRIWSKDALLTQLYDLSQDFPEIKIIDVFVCKTRNKLAGTGIEIETVWGVGYKLADVEQVKKYLANPSTIPTEEKRQQLRKKPIYSHLVPGHPRAKLHDHLRDLCLGSPNRKAVVSWKQLNEIAPELHQLSPTLDQLRVAGVLTYERVGPNTRGTNTKWLVTWGVSE